MFNSSRKDASCLPDKVAKRRTIDDRAAALRAQLAEFMLHAGPDAAQIHGGHVVEALRRLIG